MDIKIKSYIKGFNKFENKEVQLKCTYLSDLYHRVLGKNKIGKPNQILIQLSNLSEASFSDPQDKKACPSANLNIHPDLFEKPTDYQYEWMLEKIHFGLMSLAQIYDWDKTPFLDAYQKLKGVGFELHTTLDHDRKSPNKSQTASIHLIKRVRENVIGLQYKRTDEDGKFSYLYGLKTVFGDYTLNDFLGSHKGKWLDEITFQWLTKDKVLEVIFDTEKKQIALCLHPTSENEKRRLSVLTHLRGLEPTEKSNLALGKVIILKHDPNM